MILPKQPKATEQGEQVESTGAGRQYTLLADSINQVRRGQLDPRIANATGYLAGILLKALEQGHTEQRLSHLETILGCNKSVDGEVFHFPPKA